MIDSTSATRDLLFEVGMAEVPARFLPGMIEQLRQRTLAALDEARLGPAAAVAYGAPRRAAVIVRDLAVRQPDRELEVRGPSARAAFDDAGEPTAAANGFARGQGVAVADLLRREVAPGNEYVFAVKTEVGAAAEELLPDLLAGVLAEMGFPRNMRWGDYDFGFVRPIRWLLCLFGRTPLRVVVPGLPASLADPPGHSRGHRFLAPGPIPIETPTGYVAALRDAGVVVDQAERRELITAGARAAAAEAGGEPDLAPDLVEELVWLAERPTAVLGGFDPAYLDLPEPVLVTVMQHHQRFLAVRDDGGGRLLPNFIGVRDGDREHLDVVRRGYETVLRARLADAEFFYREDRKRPLAGRGSELAGLVYHQELGTMADKAGRLGYLVGELCRLLALAPADRAAGEQAAGLAKCDLATQMVRELPELQGVLGAAYARLDGVDPAAAEAIGEQYLPAGEGTATPATPAGLALALADRLDALVGYHYADVRPTGSQDPYGLRRAAGGVVAGLLAQGRHLDLAAAVAAAARAYHRVQGFAAERLDEAAAEALALIETRIEAALAEAGLAHDEVAAVLGGLALGRDPVALVAAGEALRRSRGEEWFRAACAAAVRVAGLGAKAAAADPDAAAPSPELFAEDVERDVYAAYQAVAAKLVEHRADSGFIDYWRELAALRGPVDRFFDGVLVMAPEPAVRANRLALCATLHRAFAAVADLSRLVWPGGDPTSAAAADPAAPKAGPRPDDRGRA